MRRFKKLILPFIIMALAPLSASTVVPELATLNLDTKYNVTAGPAGIGRLRITLRESGFDYSLKVDTKTSGLVRLFSREQSVAMAKGIRRDGTYVPRLYTSVADKKGSDSDREVRLDYDQDGVLTKRHRTPMDAPTYRPVVPLEQLKGATDPITGFLLLRTKLRDVIANGGSEASVQTYDGARLATMTVKVISRARVEVRGKYVNAINTVVTRQPVNGYTKKELGKFKEGDPTIHAYFSADERFIPLKLTITLGFGDITAVLDEIATRK